MTAPLPTSKLMQIMQRSVIRTSFKTILLIALTAYTSRPIKKEATSPSVELFLKFLKHFVQE